MLAAFLFGIGSGGLLLLTTAEQRHWGPFQPPSRPVGPSQVIVYDVSPPFEFPPLHDLFTGGASPTAFVAATEAQVTEAPEVADDVSEPEPEPTPTPAPIRIFGVSSDDPGVSAAAQTPTPVVLRFGGISADSAEEATETPTPESTPEATPEP